VLFIRRGGFTRNATGSSLANGQEKRHEKRSGRIQKSGKVGSSIEQFYEEKRARFYKLPLPSNDNHWAVARCPAIPRSRFSSSRSSRHCNKAAFRQFSSQISPAFVGVPVETCLYNSAANPVMARKTCFVKQFAERRVRLNTFTGAQVNLEMILCIRSLSDINCKRNNERSEQFLYEGKKFADFCEQFCNIFYCQIIFSFIYSPRYQMRNLFTLYLFYRQIITFLASF